MIYETREGKLFGILHIPRTGGRFVKMNLLLNGMKPVDCARFNNLLEYECRKAVHFTKTELFNYLGRLGELEGYSDIPFYSICRNPADRFVSASNNLRSEQKEKMHQSFDRFKEVMEEEYTEVSMPSCEIRIKGILRSPDSFFRFQTDYMDDSIDFMRYEEGFDTIFEWLSDELKTNIQTIEKRLILDRRNSVDNAVKDISAETVEFAREYYKEDYSSFGYPIS